jgi:WD40 repeat protein
MSKLVSVSTTTMTTPSEPPSLSLPRISTQLTCASLSVVNKVAFHHDGRTIAACSADHSLKMWDSRTHQLIQHYPAHSESVTDMSLHPVRSYLPPSLDLSDRTSERELYSHLIQRLLDEDLGHSGGSIDLHTPRTHWPNFGSELLSGRKFLRLGGC